MVKLESVRVDCWYKKLLFKKKRFIENLVLIGYPSISPDKKPWQQHRIALLNEAETKSSYLTTCFLYQLPSIDCTALFRLHTAIFCESIFLLFFWSMYVLIYFCNKGSSLHIRLKNLLNILDERLPERRFFKQVVYKMFTYLVISIARPCTILKENSSVHSGW